MARARWRQYLAHVLAGAARAGSGVGSGAGGQNRYKQHMSDHQPPELTPHASLPEIPVVLPGARASSGSIPTG